MFLYSRDGEILGSIGLGLFVETWRVMVSLKRVVEEISVFGILRDYEEVL